MATRPVIGCSLRDKGKIPEGVVKMDQSENCGGDRQSHFYNRNIDNHQKMPRGDLTHKSIWRQTERLNANTRTSILLQFMIKLCHKIVTNILSMTKVSPFRPRIVNVRTNSSLVRDLTSRNRKILHVIGQNRSENCRLQ